MAKLDHEVKFTDIKRELLLLAAFLHQRLSYFPLSLVFIDSFCSNQEGRLFDQFLRWDGWNGEVS